MLREPLWYFLLAGAVLFAFADSLGDGNRQRIVVTDAERTRLADQWRAQMGRDPTQSELAALVLQWIREEIYYREAIALGLDEGDVIIRRRLAQKLTFLTEDLATAEAAGDDVLREHHHSHPERYTEPARFSFEHRYFSSERRADAQADARAALAAADPPEGDPFMLQRSYLARSQGEIGELFGREFAAALAALPEGSWQGPVPSAYGWHLVRMERRHPARPLAFHEVREQVAADVRQEQRRQANEAFYQSLRNRYEIITP